jgi:NAD-reducing hydrogenase small subunit
MAKKKLATVWLGGCSGCHMSFLDIDERILDLAAMADIVKCPVVDGKDLPPVDITLVEGSVTSDEHEQELLHIRKQSKMLVALGDCAITTNITGMRNYFRTEDVMRNSYADALSNDRQGTFPDDRQLLRLHDKVLPLHELVTVDYMIPGCPPDADTIFYVLSELLQDRVPDLDRVKKLKYG